MSEDRKRVDALEIRVAALERNYYAGHLQPTPPAAEEVRGAIAKIRGAADENEATTSIAGSQWWQGRADGMRIAADEIEKALAGGAGGEERSYTNTPGHHSQTATDFPTPTPGDALAVAVEKARKRLLDYMTGGSLPEGTMAFLHHVEAMMFTAVDDYRSGKEAPHGN
jgi:hypothetical protein